MSQIFFHLFIKKMHDIREQFIGYPSTARELDKVMSRCEDSFLPGGGSIDVTARELDKVMSR
jgi:hypothetical protein